MEDREKRNYYQLLRPQLLEALAQILMAGKGLVISKYSQELADELVLDVYDEFKKLIPGIPYIGGDANPFTGNLLFSAQLLPLFT